MKKLMVLIFNETDIQDLWGAVEVFAATNEKMGFEVFEAAVVAENESPIMCANGWKVTPTYTLVNCPQPDILVITGGRGVWDTLETPGLLTWIKDVFEDAEFFLAIGSGAYLPAKAGLLDGLAATADKEGLKRLAEISSEIKIMSVNGFVDSGKIITAANSVSGMDASLFIVSKVISQAAAQRTASYIDFEWENRRHLPVQKGITYQ